MVKEEIKTENEKKKEYLKSYKWACRACKTIEDELLLIRSNEMCPSMKYSNMPGAHNKRDLSDYAVEYEKLIFKLQNARYKRIKLFSEIVSKIESLESEREKEILRLKYIHCLNWEKICTEIGYEWAQVHRDHGNALRNFPL